MARQLPASITKLCSCIRCPTASRLQGIIASQVLWWNKHVLLMHPHGIPFICNNHLTATSNYHYSICYHPVPSVRHFNCGRYWTIAWGFGGTIEVSKRGAIYITRVMFISSNTSLFIRVPSCSIYSKLWDTHQALFFGQYVYILYNWTTSSGGCKHSEVSSLVLTPLRINEMWYRYE